MEHLSVYFGIDQTIPDQANPPAPPPSRRRPPPSLFHLLRPQGYPNYTVPLRTSLAQDLGSHLCCFADMLKSDCSPVYKASVLTYVVFSWFCFVFRLSCVCVCVVWGVWVQWRVFVGDTPVPKDSKRLYCNTKNNMN